MHRVGCTFNILMFFVFCFQLAHINFYYVYDGARGCHILYCRCVFFKKLKIQTAAPSAQNHAEYPRLGCRCFFVVGQILFEKNKQNGKQYVCSGDRRRIFDFWTKGTSVKFLFSHTNPCFSSHARASLGTHGWTWLLDPNWKYGMRPRCHFFPARQMLRGVCLVGSL